MARVVSNGYSKSPVENSEGFLFSSASEILQHHSFLHYASLWYFGEVTLVLRGKQKELQGIQDALKDRILPVIQEGQAEGTFDQTFTASFLYETFSRIVAPLAAQRRAFSQQATDEEIIAIITRLYLKTVLASP